MILLSQTFRRIKIYYYQIAILNSPLAPFTYVSDEIIEEGRFVTIKLRGKLTKGIIYSQCEEPKFKCEKVQEVLCEYLPLKYQKLVKFLSNYYSCSHGESANLFNPFIDSQKVEDIQLKIDLELSALQSESLDFIDANEIALLFGDTGSGKTEIYMKLFEKVINEGKSAILLMPEISLTPQIEKRLQEKFGSLVVLWHSKITKKSKEKILDSIYSGEVRIVAGARSALFLPLQNIGAIVVDEEHDDSYKSASRPRYHARDVAIYMGKLLGAKVVLGSATPSLSSYHKFAHFRLRGTFHKSSREFLFEKAESSVTELIKSEITKTLHRGKQAIIFLPTRANFKYLFCNECGSFIECPYCSVGMSIHKEKNALVCHYCNYIERIAQICPKCQSSNLRTNRIGTAEVVDELEENFKEANIVKFDKDEITTATKLKKVLKDFNDKKIDILVGTQMLSKGHDYHEIDLAIILGIDNILAMADFRARERAMSLLFQIAGRSGRRGDGRVLIQTQNREFFEHFLDDYEIFLKDEINYRVGIYPPFKKLMKLLISDKNKNRAKDTLSKLSECLQNCDVEVVGYGEAPINKISSKFRFQVLLRSDFAKILLQSAAKCQDKSIEIDIDPVNFS